jgi:hypothetical protein
VGQRPLGLAWHTDLTARAVLPPLQLLATSARRVRAARPSQRAAIAMREGIEAVFAVDGDDGVIAEVVNWWKRLCPSGEVRFVRDRATSLNR